MPSHNSFNPKLDEPLAAPSQQAVDGVSRLTRTVSLAGKWIRLNKVALFIASILLFIFAISMMKESAGDLTPLLYTVFDVSNAANSLGFGWLFAYVILSGSPVAAVALTFFDAGAIDKLSAFTMIIGSRLGASFIVLFIGFIYMLRGRDKTSGLSIGLLSLTVTGTTYLVSLIIGLALLQMGLVDHLQPQFGTELTSVIDLVISPVVRLLRSWLPLWALFLIGLGLIMLSFNLFDRCLPQMAIKESQVGRVSRLVYRPWVMFLLGSVVTLISMSVSISLSILVPLSNRGFIRRENVIPYIMGTNVTTFIDTLLAAVLLNNPAAFSIVLSAMLSITIVSTLILSLRYHHYERAILTFVNWISASTLNLIIFIAIIVVIPIVLMLI